MKKVCIVAVGALALLLGGCGGGGSSSSTSTVPLQAQVNQARKAGEEAAHEKDRVDSLEKKVKKLSRKVSGAGHSTGQEAGSAPAAQATAAPPPAQDAEPPVREFHVESGNVSCEVGVDGATCTVEPISETFSFADGEAGYSESGSALPEYLGEVVPYGSSVTVGSVDCEIPPTNVARGIVCSDEGTGHGFEASRVASRQKVY